MIEVTAFVMGICAPERLKYLNDTLTYMDSQNFPFKKKILAIDEFGGHTFPREMKFHFENKGWTILIDSHRSRKLSMDHAFQHIDTEYVFYNEDDVQVTLPNIEDLNKIFAKTKVNDRECGMISLTLGGSISHFPANEYGDLNLVKDNVLLENDNYLIFRRLEEKRNDFFFEFPALFIKTKLFKECHRVATKFFSGQQVEMGLTSAWFSSFQNEKYYKCSLAKKDIYGIVCDDPLTVFKKSRLIECLDPQQGSSPVGGNHVYH